MKRVNKEDTIIVEGKVLMRYINSDGSNGGYVVSENNVSEDSYINEKVLILDPDVRIANGSRILSASYINSPAKLINTNAYDLSINDKCSGIVIKDCELVDRIYITNCHNLLLDEVECQNPINFIDCRELQVLYTNFGGDNETSIINDCSGIIRDCEYNLKQISSLDLGMFNCESYSWYTSEFIGLGENNSILADVREFDAPINFEKGWGPNLVYVNDLKIESNEQRKI